MVLAQAAAARLGLLLVESELEGVVRRAAVGAVHEREGLGEGAAARLFQGEAEQGGGLGVEGGDEAAGVGDDHGLGEVAQGGGDELGRGGVGVEGEADQGHGVAGDAQQIAAATELALVTDDDGHGLAGGVVQIDDAAADAGFGVLGVKKVREALGEDVGGQRDRERGGFGQGDVVLARAGAEQAMPSGGKPVLALREIEVEGGEAALGAEALEALVVEQADLLQLLALGDVEVQAADALQRALGAKHAHAGARDPEVVAFAMAQAILDGEGAGAGGLAARSVVGRGGGVVGVDEAAPAGERVGQLVLGVAEEAFPAGRGDEFAGVEAQVEKAEAAAIGQQGEGLLQGVGGEGRRGRAGALGQNGEGGEPGGFVVVGGVEPQVVGVRAGKGPDALRTGGGGAEERLPLDVQHRGVVGGKLEAEERDEASPAQRLGRPAEGDGRGRVGRTNDSLGVDQQNGGCVGRGGYCHGMRTREAEKRRRERRPMHASVPSRHFGVEFLTGF